eukprot:16436226-Heterocapsa_arctica.AAC.1
MPSLQPSWRPMPLHSTPTTSATTTWTLSRRHPWRRYGPTASRRTTRRSRLAQARLRSLHLLPSSRSCSNTPRARSRRGSSEGSNTSSLKVVSINCTAWGTLKGIIESRVLTAEVVLVQEHHLAQDGCDTARKTALWHGWEADFIPARETGQGGTSGRVAIL